MDSSAAVGSGEDAAAATAAAAAAVCCMCGDHGLSRELFRCSHCRRRLQHKYCSELYPKVGAYRRCNWCLREQRGRWGLPPAASRRMSAALGTAANDVGSEEDKGGRRSYGGGCSRSAFCVEPGKPVKKPKAGDDGRLVMPVQETGETTKGRKLIRHAPGGKVRPLRVKVRRYKLLTDVISCS